MSSQLYRDICARQPIFIVITACAFPAIDIVGHSSGAQTFACNAKISVWPDGVKNVPVFPTITKLPFCRLLKVSYASADTALPQTTEDPQIMKPRRFENGILDKT
jgi:hypothetical protein